MRTTQESGSLFEVGPSLDYEELLRGEIDSEEYVRRLKAKVDDRMRVPLRRVRAVCAGVLDPDSLPWHYPGDRPDVCKFCRPHLAWWKRLLRRDV